MGFQEGRGGTEINTLIDTLLGLEQESSEREEIEQEPVEEPRVDFDDSFESDLRKLLFLIKIIICTDVEKKKLCNGFSRK